MSKKICNTILAHAKDRFSFTAHLVNATLLQAEMFEQHCRTFPGEALDATVMLNKAKLKTELSLIYENAEFNGCCDAPALYQLKLRGVFSTLKRIKTFLRNAMGQERLNAFPCSPWRGYQEQPDFNERAIDHFAALKERRANFQAMWSK
ncbi:hypothetical protein L3Q82_023412 [Scortum barcoo]|uniref:Uncharacterized protein n=1 Tax=Scortum barcoo TaxID=214431 RepID=A0ACB8WZU9_9TELE|nr:hypothetical protein L3Q82_023412 [Scortum barcoo]